MYPVGGRDGERKCGDGGGGGGERGACAGAGIDQHGVSFDQTERERAPPSKQGMEGERRLF